MQVKFHISVLHFDKIMPLFKSSNLHTIKYKTLCRVRSVNPIQMEKISSDFSKIFNSTR